MSNPIPTSEKADLDWLEAELDEWKGIQVMINESHQNMDDWILHCSWTSDIPFLCLYHTLVEDGIRSGFGKAYNAKTREELDGRNTTLFQDFYELAARQFNNANWIPIVLLFLIFMKTFSLLNLYHSTLHQSLQINSRRC